MIEFILNKIVSVLDTLLSWLFSIIPNDFLADFINPILDNVFDFIFTILSSFIYYVDFLTFSYILSVIFWLEICYLLIKLTLWAFSKISLLKFW